MAVGSGRSTLGSENRKRIEESSMDFHNLPLMLETKLDCQLVQVLIFLVVPSPYLSMSRQQGGCLSSSQSLLLSKISDLT